MGLIRRQLGFGVQVLDVLVAAGLLALGEIDVFYRLNGGDLYFGSRGYNAALCALVAPAVLVRRRWSLPAVMWVTVVVCLSRPYLAHDTSLYEGFLPLIVLTAGAAVFETRRRSIIALLVAEAGLALYLAAEPSLRSVSTGIADGMFILLPWVAATILHARTQQAHRLSSDLEQTRIERAAREREILADERARIARELHDVVAHSVSVMVVNIGAARINLHPEQEPAQHALVVAEETGRQALAELRRLLGVLRQADHSEAASASPQPDLGRLDILGEQMAGTGLAVRIHRLGDPRPLPPALELNAYRIVQEGLTNALRHGNATAADVTLRFGESTLGVEVVDNGTGHSQESPLPRSGHGLIGARERTHLFGGRLEAEALADGGWRLKADFPLASSEGVVSKKEARQ